jgi:sulfoxide reductase catalytic subunit YedY
MLIRHAPDLKENEVTDHGLYLRRREFIAGAGLVGAGLATSGLIGVGTASAAPLKGAPSPLSTKDEKLTPKDDITTYNNFYEFGTDKSDPAQNAKNFQPRPWTVVIDGECAKPQRLGIDDLIKRYPLEERIYRMRCVEAWSMVIPWVGFPLAALIKDAEPTAKAKFVAFETLNDPARMPGQRDPVLRWPYREGLRLDEATNPLTLMAVGLYGETLPNQNGAPLRLVTPWKYGFKGIKSVVRIRFVANQPETAWNIANAREYGFYSNVNPEVDHPRWSQASERRIGEFFRRKTLPFNGYGAQVASMYKGMDLKKFY